MVRILRDNRERHDRGRLHLRTIQGSLRNRALAGVFYIERLELLRRRNLFRFLELRKLHSLLDVTKHGKARLRIVEHVPRLATASFDRFHVVLDAYNRISKPIGFLLRQLRRTAVIQYCCDKSTYAIDNLHGASLVEHEQAGFDTTDQRRKTVEPARRRCRGKTLTDGFLDACKINYALTHDGLGDLTELLGVFR